jgi:phenylacetate-coenzyme A ligase PaaK-like adenylate-forming protein
MFNHLPFTFRSILDEAISYGDYEVDRLRLKKGIFGAEMILREFFFRIFSP